MNSYRTAQALMFIHIQDKYHVVIQCHKTLIGVKIVINNTVFISQVPSRSFISLNSTIFTKNNRYDFDQYKNNRKHFVSLQSLSRCFLHLCFYPIRVESNTVFSSSTYPPYPSPFLPWLHNHSYPLITSTSFSTFLHLQSFLLCWLLKT